MKELKIMLQMPGLVVFDPEVMKSFIVKNELPTPNVLQGLIDNPGLGNDAITGGRLISIYSITPWDYRIIINESSESTLPAGWALFEVPPFVLCVESGKVVVSDIWAILNWKEETYLQYKQLTTDKGDDFNVNEVIEMPNGWYQVTIIGFRDSQNSDIENRKCGYELLLVKNENAQFEVSGSIDRIDFDVVGLPEEWKDRQA